MTKIFIGADHRGVLLKSKVVSFLERLGHVVEDVGSFDANTPCDYPKYSFLVGEAVVKNKKACGILICMTGIGHSIAINKVKGIRAALCYHKQSAILSRQHNDANVLIVGSKFVSEKEMLEMIKSWLKTPFEGGRHLRRVNKIKAYEKKVFKA